MKENNKFEVELAILDKDFDVTGKNVLNIDNILDDEPFKYVYLKYKKTNESSWCELYIKCDCNVAGSKYSYLEDDKLDLLLNTLIIKIDLNTGSLLLKNEADTTACNYELYKVDDDYLIIGEWEITRIGQNFDLIWQWTGNDIFDDVNVDFEKNVINVVEFMNSSVYSINFEGIRV